MEWPDLRDDQQWRREDRGTIPKPDAPSLVCLNKETGKVYWKDNSPGSNILVTQFASPDRGRDQWPDSK